jgi:hypothetical protein
MRISVWLPHAATSSSWKRRDSTVNRGPSPSAPSQSLMLACSCGATALARSARSAHNDAVIGSIWRIASARSETDPRRDCRTSPNMYAEDSALGASTTEPPTLPRRTVRSPSLSRMRRASRSDGRLMRNSSSSSSCLGSRSPSPSSPLTMRSRRTDATMSASRGWRSCARRGPGVSAGWATATLYPCNHHKV